MSSEAPRGGTPRKKPPLGDASSFAVVRKEGKCMILLARVPDASCLHFDALTRKDQALSPSTGVQHAGRRFCSRVHREFLVSYVPSWLDKSLSSLHIADVEIRKEGTNKHFTSCH